MATNLTYTTDQDGTGVDYNVATTSPTSVRLQDINGDNKLDLLVSGSQGASVSLNDGNGAFGTPTVYTPAIAFAKDVQVADIDGDGKQDLVVFNSSNTFTVYKGNGTGTFANPQAITWISGGQYSVYSNSYTVADITGDGKLDVMVADGGQNYATLLTNTSSSGNFSFTAGTSIGPFSQTLRGGIYVTDVDGDNDQDVIVMKANVDIAVLTNTNGVLSLGKPLVSIPDFPSYGAAGDLNGDGKPDIAFATNNTLYLALSGTNAYTVSAPISLGTTVRALTIADVNADGKQDVVVTYGSVSGSGVDKVAVLLGNGDGTLQTATTVVSTSIKLEQKGTAVGDLNGDGHPDLVVVNGKNGSTIVGNASVYLNSSVSGPAITFSALALSADTGSSNSDFITQTATQTLTATLSGTLANGDVVQGSLDNGVNWTDITSKVSTTTLTWDGITLSGSNTLKLKVTNNSLDGAMASQAYVLDALAPSPTLTAASLKVSDNAVVQSTETGTAYLVKNSVTVTDLASITNAADNNFNSVGISAANTNTNLALTGLVDGTYKLYTVDAAGNLSTVSSTSIKIDSLAPTDIALSSSTSPIAANATVGSLSATDATVGDAFTYSLVTNTGDNALSADNAKFAISNGSLVVGANALTDGSAYKITLRVTDTAGNTFDEAFTINAVDAPAVSSIVRQSNNAQTTQGKNGLNFLVTFNKNVDGVTVDDFEVVKASTVTGTPTLALTATNVISGVVLANGGNQYIVKVTGLAGDGSVSVNLKSSGTGITATTGGAAIQTGFSSGQDYVLDNTAPSVTLSNLALSSDTGTAGDFITNTASQTISATLGAPLETGGRLLATIGEYGTGRQSQVLQYVDITSKVNGTGVNWDGVTLLASGTIQFQAVDTLGNTSLPFGTQAYTVKTAAPTFSAANSTPADNATGFTVSSDIVVKLNAALHASSDLTKVYLKEVSTGNTVAAVITLNSDGNIVINPNANLGYSTAYYVSWDANALKDAAGNVVTAVNDATTYNFSTESAPVAPAPTTPAPTPATNTAVVDGVTVQSATVTKADGSKTEQVTIAPVTANRVEDSATTNAKLADIPLFWGESTRTQASTVVSLPTGVGLVTEGARAPDATQNAVTTLNQLINSTVASTDTSKTNMLSASDSFLQALSQTNAETLVINKVTITTADNTTVASTTPIVISGTNKAVTTSTGVSQTPTEALVIDTRALPKGSIIDLQNIEFAVIVGDNVTIRGGDGANVFFAGAGNQNIRLGADDDELHAGDGDDWVGSQGGNDKLFGDAGNDVLYGGAGNDTLDGGIGTDIALFQYALNQYQVKQNSDGTWTISHAIEGTDTLKDIEFAEFANQTITLSGSNQWMNQLFNQSYGLF